MPDTVTRRNLSRGGASPGSEIPDSELRITAGLPFPHGPRHPARPIRENPRTARTSGLQPCDSGPNMKSARTAEPVRRDETACRRPEPLAAARFRALHPTPGRPHRDSARLDASGIMRTSTVPNMLNRLRQHLTFGPQRPRHPQTECRPLPRKRLAPAAPTRQGQDRTRPRRTRPKRLFLPVPGSRERHFPYTSPRPAFSVFFISEMIVIGPTPPGTGVI